PSTPYRNFGFGKDSTMITRRWQLGRAPARPSMRHQHRHCHGGKNAAGDAAEDEFAQPRMPVAAEHHEFGADVGSVGEDRIGHVDAAAGADALDLDVDAVPRQMAAHVGAGDLAALVALASDDDDLDRLGAREEGQRIGDRARSRPAAVPAYQDAVEFD